MIKIDIDKSVMCNEDLSLFVSFPYDANIVDIIREQLIRYWDAENKRWELPFSTLDKLVSAFQNYEIEIDADADMLFAKQTEVPVDFEFKTKPFEHQKVAFKYGFEHSKWLLGDEQGLGKTKEVIDIAVAKKLQNNYKHCLIICCVNGLKWNWKNEISIHSNESGHILGQRVNRKGRLVVDGNAEKLADLQNLPEDYFIITNVESLRSPQIIEKIVELCDAGEIDMIAVDEVHKCKNGQSTQGKAFLKLHAKTMIAMTGTPLMNSPMDLYVILKWLGAENHSFYSFRNHYCEMGGYGGYEIMAYKNLDELQTKLDAVMLRRKKEEVLDLPEKIYISEYVEMDAKQAQIYKEVSMDIQANIDQIKKSNNPLSQMIRLRQATGYTGILSSQIKESAKLDRMEELVEESVSNKKQVIVFSNWTQMTDAVEEKLANYRVGIITGDTKDEDRMQIVDDFQNGKYDVLCGTIGAMGTGLTATAATVEIFLDEPWSRALKDQAEDRAHRIGQNSNLTIYTLITKNTIDERINELVEQKGKMAGILVDGEIKIDKGELVDFLLS